MEYFLCFIEFLNVYFRPILLVIGSCLAIYLGVQKFGSKITAQYTVSDSTYTTQHISNIVLTNKKDKPQSIWAIFALFNKDYQLELDKFNPPLILKPYESISIKLPEYSSLSIGGDEYKPDFFGEVAIYADVGERLLKCSEQNKKDVLSNFKHISKQKIQFNGHVYNHRVTYIIDYLFDGKVSTAFVCGGFITNEWDFSPNHLGNKEISSRQLESFLKMNGFDKVFSNYHCYKVNYPHTEFVFAKKLEDA